MVKGGIWSCFSFCIWTARSLLLDEPFTELDPVYSEQLVDLLRAKRLCAVSLLPTMITIILQVSDRLILLRDGIVIPVRGREDLKNWGYLPEDGGKRSVVEVKRKSNWLNEYRGTVKSGCIHFRREFRATAAI